MAQNKCCVGCGAKTFLAHADKILKRKVYDHRYTGPSDNYKGKHRRKGQ